MLWLLFPGHWKCLKYGCIRSHGTPHKWADSATQHGLVDNRLALRYLLPSCLCQSPCGYLQEQRKKPGSREYPHLSPSIINSNIQEPELIVFHFLERTGPTFVTEKDQDKNHSRQKEKVKLEGILCNGTHGLRPTGKSQWTMVTLSFITYKVGCFNDYI